MRCPRLCLAAAVSFLLLASAGGCRRAKPDLVPRDLQPAGAPVMLLDIPPAYAIERRQGADFEVFYIQRPRTQGSEPAKDGMGIYFGHAPNFSPPREARTSSGTVAGRKVTWSAWEDDTTARKLLRMQALIPDLFADQKEKAGGVAGLQVHIFLWAPDEKSLELLRESAETLRRK